MFAALGEFIGAILKALFKPFMELYKEPNEVVSTGFDTEIEDDIDTEIDDEFGFLDNEAHTSGKDQPQ